MRPLWRDLILKVWGRDPLECSCCKGIMKPVRQVIRREEIQFFLRLHGLWEGIIQLARPPPPPFDIETVEPIEPPWQAIKEWIPDDEPDLDWFNRPRNPSNPDPDGFDQSPEWQAPEIQLADGRTLVLGYPDSPGGFLITTAAKRNKSWQSGLESYVRGKWKEP